MAAGQRLGGPRVAVDDALRERLASVCRVDADDEARAEHGRDWWPLALRWALDGDVPALPALVVHPTTATEVAALDPHGILNPGKLGLASPWGEPSWP